MLLLLNTSWGEAAGERLWVKRYGNLYAGADYARGMVVDKDGNVIVTGQSLGYADTYYDYAVVKYGPAGNRLWVRRYNGGPGAYDEPFGVATDREGNIIVTGKGIGQRGVGLPDIVTVKYSPAGVLQWARRYFGGDAGHEEGRAVITDSAGNIYVAGIVSSTSNNYHDAVLIKYSPAGVRLWVRTYDAPFHDNDGYFAVAVDGADNVLAAGFSIQSGLNLSDVITAKYNPAGTRLWLRTYDDEEGLDDWAESIAIDKWGNAVVTGSQGESCDAEGGYCFSYATIKYSSAGIRQWVATYNPKPTSDDLAHAVRVDNAGNVYVTGESSWTSAFYDFATVKYSPAGNQLWAKRFDGVGHGNDMAYGLAVDSKGNVIVAGQSYASLDAESDFTVVKYSSGGARKWVRRYNGPGDGMDTSFCVAVDNQDNVYAAGFSLGQSTTAEDFVTIKYAP
jgi:uncharacterized delta-60 repeat protein